MAVQTANRKPSPPPPVEARQAVKELLLQSAAFSKLPPETQQQIARDATRGSKRADAVATTAGCASVSLFASKRVYTIPPILYQFFEDTAVAHTIEDKTRLL